MKRVNWLDHLVNLLVVILGITIAFYFESSKESRQAKQEERKYLESLLVDLEADIAMLDTLQKVNVSIKEAAISLSNTANDSVYQNEQQLVKHILLIQYNPYFTPQRTVYASLQSSGKSSIISDFDIRNRVAELYEQYYRGIGEYDQALNEHVRDFVKPFFINQITFKTSNTVDPAFLKQSEFRNQLFLFRYLFIQKSDFYETVSEEVRLLKEQLADYIETL